MACVHHCCPKAACSASRRFPLAAAGSELGLLRLCSGGHGERAIGDTGGWTTLCPSCAGLDPAKRPSLPVEKHYQISQDQALWLVPWICCLGSHHLSFCSVDRGSPGDLYPAPSPWVALRGLLLRRRLSSTASDFNIKSHFKFFVVFSPFVLCLNKRCEFIHCKNICVTVG